MKSGMLVQKNKILNESFFLYKHFENLRTRVVSCLNIIMMFLNKSWHNQRFTAQFRLTLLLFLINSIDFFAYMLKNVIFIKNQIFFKIRQFHKVFCLFLIDRLVKSGTRVFSKWRFVQNMPKQDFWTRPRRQVKVFD